MKNEALKLDAPDFETKKLKELLGEACVEIAKWKVKHDQAQKRIADLERQLRQIGVVRLPVGGVVR